MAVTLIDINDIDVRIYTPNATLYSSPGIAHLNREGLVFGATARAKSRIEPQGLFDNYWNQLDDVPLPRRYRGIRHHADLVYHHLNKLKDEYGPFEQAIFLTPSDYSSSKLSLLLGIAEALGIKVQAFIDNAIANVAQQSSNTANIQFLDLSLHRTCISHLTSAETTRFERMQTLERYGKNHFDGIAIKWVADCFLDQARFDPLHQAVSEQIIYNELDNWIAELRHAAHINVALQHQGRQHEVSLAQSELIATLEPAFKTLGAALNQQAQIVLSHRFAIYPQQLLANVNPYIVDEIAGLQTVEASLEGLDITPGKPKFHRSLGTPALANKGMNDGA